MTRKITSPHVGEGDPPKPQAKEGGGGPAARTQTPAPKRRSPPGHIRTVHLRRARFLPQDGGGTVFCVMTYRGDPHAALAYLPPGQFPEFAGEEAWFRVRWVSKAKREFLEQVEGV